MSTAALARPQRPAARGRWTPGALLRALWEGGRTWLADGGPRLGAAVAFYSLFALSPLIVLATAIASLAFGADTVRGEFITQLSGVVGESAARSVEGMITAAWNPEAGWIAGIVGLVTLLVGATGVLVELRSALDAMLHIRDDDAKKNSAISRLVRARVAAVALVLGFGFLLIVSLMLSTLLAAVGVWLTGLYPALKALLAMADVVVSMIILTTAFAAIIRWLPTRATPWRTVLTAALLSAGMFTVGKYLVGLYLANAGFVSAYGAAGSLAVLLIWIYFTCQLMLLAVAIAQRLHDGPSARR